jgi:cardiolipin synthase A/B
VGDRASFHVDVITLEITASVSPSFHQDSDLLAGNVPSRNRKRHMGKVLCGLLAWGRSALLAARKQAARTMVTRLTVVAALALPLLTCAAPSHVDRKVIASTAPLTEREAIERLMKISSHFERLPFVGGNDVMLLQDGPATYAAMTAAISSATRRIDMESYQFDSAGASKFAPLLIQKRAQGVQVHLIYDAWGSMAQDKILFDQLRRAGVQVVAYNPLGADGKIDLDLNRRDHRKLLVVDGATVITGGVNVTGAYLNPEGSVSADPEKMEWRDTDVRIEGPVAAQFEGLWETTWKEQHGPPLDPAPATPGFVRGPSIVQAIDGAPVDGHPVIYETLLAAFALAKSSIHLTTGFFAPTPEMDEALQDAARRGVDVAIVVPAHSDSEAAREAGRSHYTDLLEAGVKIYERQGVVLHAKTAVVDGLWSTVGSSNLDWRSTILNNEIDAVILGRDFGTEMEAMFRQDVAASKRITPEMWAQRGLGERINEIWARMLDKVL